ncbi:MAG TPA: hypothetical protein QGG93_06355, partial [Verrucomicrobiota bacterium]|nr:hypothetical protein [Verrucomicrobiota bacterium]
LISLKGRPIDIPEILEPDVSHLEVGQSIHLNEIDLPEGVVALGSPKTLLVAVATSRMQMMAEAEEAAAAEAAEAATEGEDAKESAPENAAEGGSEDQKES